MLIDLFQQSNLACNFVTLASDVQIIVSRALARSEIERVRQIKQV